MPNPQGRNQLAQGGIFDFTEAVNAVSDVVMNRPPPIREFDQIYMKVGDMVHQALFVAERFKGQRVVFMGDGDGIGLSIMHLYSEGILDKAPAEVMVLDFDERIVNSIMEFSDKYRFSDRISACLYNVIDPLPDDFIRNFDAFYTNPPWGRSNGGESVRVFLDRCIEAIEPRGKGALVIADDPALDWTQEVIADAQASAYENGLFVVEQVPDLHIYHLESDPDLKSCCIIFGSIYPDKHPVRSKPIDTSRCRNFYGKRNPLSVRYVREINSLNLGRASEDTYWLEILESDYE